MSVPALRRWRLQARSAQRRAATESVLRARVLLKTWVGSWTSATAEKWTGYITDLSSECHGYVTTQIAEPYGPRLPGIRTPAVQPVPEVSLQLVGVADELVSPTPLHDQSEQPLLECVSRGRYATQL